MYNVKYIIQLYNYKNRYWFDYLVFYNKDNAKRCFQNYKRNSPKKYKIRLLEIIAYDFEEC